MQEKIIGLYPKSNKMKKVEIFGYSSRGIPGIEIIGLGIFNKILKEKLTYLLKIKKVKLPLKRFVLSTSIPLQVKKSNQEDIIWLELPFYILLSRLLEIISIRNLENCLCSGVLHLNGSVKVFHYSNQIIEETIKDNYILIEDQKYNNLINKSQQLHKSIYIKDLLN